MNTKGRIALAQIFVLVLGIVAISWAIGSGAGVASADDANNGAGVASTDIPTDYPKVPFFGDLGSATGHIVQGAMYAGGVVMFIQLVGSMFLSKEETNALSIAAFGGIMVGSTTTGLLKEFGSKAMLRTVGKTKITQAGAWGIGAGVAMGLILLYATYKTESTETITFTCGVWQAPTGGEHCEECNEQGILPCSEYQCRSLGQACELLNAGTEDEKCAWVDRKDVTFPTIQPWESVLSDDHKYSPDNTISPPDRGVKIVRTDSTTGCIKAFTPLTFGVFLDEPAQCKIDPLRKANFEEMDYYFGGSTLFKYNHTQVMSLPGPSALEADNLTIENDGDFSLYVRCQDTNGNANTANFVFKYCVEQGPDTTPPLIVTTNLLNDMPVAYNQSSVDIEVYTNEPAKCKWSHLDQNYEDMEETMTCSSSVMEMNAQMLYKCATTLTGLKDNQDNDFYFRCEDKPLTDEGSNVNQESYEFTLIGTKPLVIDEILPNETVSDASENVKVTLEVETSAGYKEGEAICYYSDTDVDEEYVQFFETNSYKHTQDLYLTEGDYVYYIKCVDLGGNTDTGTAEFDVDSDSEAPIVVRAYHEETYLKIVTDEEAECVYDTTDCTYLFDDGIKMTVVDEVNHFTDWNTETSTYIKCRDPYGSEPVANECSIIVRPFERWED